MYNTVQNNGKPAFPQHIHVIRIKSSDLIDTYSNYNDQPCHRINPPTFLHAGFLFAFCSTVGNLASYSLNNSHVQKQEVANGIAPPRGNRERQRRQHIYRRTELKFLPLPLPVNVRVVPNDDNDPQTTMVGLTVRNGAGEGLGDGTILFR